MTSTAAPYYLLFFLPGDMHNRIAEYESHVPPVIHVGDLYNASNVDSTNWPGKSPYFRVTSIEHKIVAATSGDRAEKFFIGVHLEQLTKEEYFQVAVNRLPGGGE